MTDETSEDTNVRSNFDNSICPICTGQMEHFGRLPRIGRRPEVKVFRCVPCKVISSKERL